MSKSIQVNSQKDNSRRISIKWTWTILLTLALFVTYIIFSTVLYISVQNIFLDNEENEISVVSEQMVSEFDSQSNSLNEETVDSIISSSNLRISDQMNNAETSPSNLGLATQNGLVIRIFNPDNEVLFTSNSGDYAFQPSNSYQVQQIDGQTDTVYSGVSPVYSNQTNELIGYVQVINTLNAYHNVIDNIVMAIIIIGIFALIFSAFVGYLIVNRLLRPIRGLTEAMNTIRKDPESDNRIDVGGGQDELTEMANSYNRMMDKVQLNIDNQKQFVEDVSHELRTPVAVVEGHLKLINRWGKEDPEVLEESIDASLQEIERMKSLVQEMLDLSRAVQVDVQYRNEKTNVVEVLNQTHTNFQMVHPNFTFHLDIDAEDDVFVNMYRNHLEQVLIILLDNAVKYSTDRPEVHISMSTQGREVQLAIQDFGEGMSEEDAEKIFNRFYRIDKARSREQGGNGLGLSIARQLIEGYGGRIWAESVLNYGSIFRIVLPILEEDELEDEEIENRENEENNENKDEIE